MLTKDERRFQAKVDKSGGPDLCWPWTGATNRRGGYGSFFLDRHVRLAHRLAFELATGVYPGDLLVMHRCDNPPCCNPAHLFLGTAKDNSRDMVQKGRHVRPAGGGGGLSGARLNESDVRSIRADLARGVLQETLASRYGVHNGTISRIWLRHTWRHVA